MVQLKSPLHQPEVEQKLTDLTRLFDKFRCYHQYKGIHLCSALHDDDTGNFG